MTLNPLPYDTLKLIIEFTTKPCEEHLSRVNEVCKLFREATLCNRRDHQPFPTTTDLQEKYLNIDIINNRVDFLLSDEDKKLFLKSICYILYKKLSIPNSICGYTKYIDKFTKYNFNKFLIFLFISNTLDFNSLKNSWTLLFQVISKIDSLDQVLDVLKSGNLTDQNIIITIISNAIGMKQITTEDQLQEALSANAHLTDPGNIEAVKNKARDCGITLTQ